MHSHVCYDQYIQQTTSELYYILGAYPFIHDWQLRGYRKGALTALLKLKPHPAGKGFISF